MDDATALIAYRFAVAAVVSGSFSLLQAAGEFVIGVAGGVAIGLAVSWACAELLKRIEDRPTEAVLTLMLPYFSYLPADALGVSGVMAAVTSGLYFGWRAPQLWSPRTRLQLNGLWEVLVFTLNSLLFVLVGLQLPAVLDGIGGESPLRLLAYALAVALTVMAVRMIWIFPFTYGPRMLSRRIRERDPSPPWQQPFLIGFTGMRGAVSLAAALAIPETIAGGGAFPARDLIIFLTFTTIIWTVCVEGLSLPWLLRKLDVRDDGANEREEDHARLAAAEAAILRIDELRDEEWVREDTAERVRGQYDFRRRRFRTRLGKMDGTADGDDPDERSLAYQRLTRELLSAQRDALAQLRREGRIGDEAMRRVERDLDLEDTRLDLERTA